MGVCWFSRAETRCWELCSSWVWSKQVISFNPRSVYDCKLGFRVLMMKLTMFIVVLKILFRLSLNFSSHLHFIVCFDCSFESMSQLCQRYNRAIDGILQLVSKVHIVYKYFFKPRCLTLARGKIKPMFFSAGVKLENPRNVLSWFAVCVSLCSHG